MKVSNYLGLLLSYFFVNIFLCCNLFTVTKVVMLHLCAVTFVGTLVLVIDGSIMYVAEICFSKGRTTEDNVT